MTRKLVLLLAVVLVFPAATRAADLDAVPVIDCHVHLWDTSRPEMTWPRKEHVKLYRPFLPKTHAPICRANGVKGVVVVLSGQALVDNQWNLDVTAHDTKLYRGVVGNMSLAIGTDRFRPLFTELCEDKRYVGYRLSGRYQDGLTDELIRDLRLTAKLGRTVDFLVGGYSLADVDEIVQAMIEGMDAAVGKTRRINAARMGSVLDDQAEQRCIVATHTRVVLHQHQARGAQRPRRAPERKLRHVNHRYRRAMPLDHAGHPLGRAGNRLGCGQRQHFGNLRHIERIAVAIEFK